MSQQFIIKLNEQGPQGAQGERGETGATGNGINYIDKTSTDGIVDTYTIYYTNGNTSTFEVTNGNSIDTIEKTSTVGIVDTYTITMVDGSTHTFTVTNGTSISSIEKTSTVGLTDTYTITLTNGDTSTFTVTNGNGIASINKTATSGLTDTYTITFTNGSTMDFDIKNGKSIVSVTGPTTVGLVDTYTINYNDNTSSTFDVTNGNGIANIEKTGSTGLIDTYTINMSNGSYETFTVTNGEKGDKGDIGVGVVGITKTSTSGLEDTYTMSYTDGSSSTFVVTNGNGIESIELLSTEGLTNNYRINFDNGTYFDYSLDNAKSIISISKVMTSGLVDTYRITFNDGSSFQFPVTNGNGVSGVTLLSWVGLDKTYRMTFTNGTYFDFTVSNGAEGQAEWGGISGVLSNQHDLQDALDLKANTSQTHALKAYSDNGELLYDAEGLADVKEYAHSTFDRSKFTVVGSPNITDDGIASWDGSPNNFWCAETPITLSQLQDKSWIFRNKWINKGVTQRPSDTTKRTQEGIIIAAGSAAYGLVCVYGHGAIGFTGRFGDLEDNTGSNQITAIAKAWNELGYSSTPSSAEVELSFDITTGIYTLRVRVEDETEWKTVGTYTPPTTNKQLWAIYNNPDRVIRFSEISVYNNVYNALDLKYASVVIDGVEVFSGNKTGIDTIKPDDYTVVGTPTISADGVASGFSNNDYITPSSNFTFGTDFELYLPFILTDNTADSNIYRFQSAGTFRGFVNYITQYGVMVNFSDGTNSMSTGGNKYAMLPADIQLNKLYIIVIKLHNQICSYGYIGDGVYNEKGTITSFALNLPEINTIYIGKGGNNAFSGKIDLNALQFYKNGNLVYQPCLKIPYTETSDNGRVVNYIYRDRVLDAYNQYSSYNSYTLQEENVPNYSVVGSPTISDDWVASGFTNNAYIRVPNVITDKPFIIKGVVHLGNVDQENIIGCLGQDWVKFIGTDYNNATVNLGKDKNENIIRLPINGGFVKNKSYVYELSWDGITYNFSTTRLDTNETKYATPVVAGASQLLKNAPALSLGINYSHPDSVPLKGSIDLNAFKIYTNGQLTYQAVIPPNFTLPCGDLYGLIGQRTLVDSHWYSDGSYWELWSDRTLEIGGTCESGVEYNLPRPFASNVYLNTIPCSAKTASSFTPSATGDFIAKGKGIL